MRIRIQEVLIQDYIVDIGDTDPQEVMDNLNAQPEVGRLELLDPPTPEMETEYTYKDGELHPVEEERTNYYLV